MTYDTKPQVKKLTEGLYFLTEEPGDWTHYSYVIAVLPKGQTFPVSVYDVAVFPTEGDGATLKRPMYKERGEVMALNEGQEEAGDVHAQADLVEFSFLLRVKNDPENPYTVASAIRCALAAIEAADSSEA